MNLKEGKRRLALLLGVVGAIFGGFASYAELQSVLGQRARHVRFEQLANSDVVQQERKLRFHTDRATGVTLDWGEAFDAQGNRISDPPLEFASVPSEVDKGGISAINWTKDIHVASIELQDGQMLYPTPAPGVWSYLLIAILPVLGFFIPWGTVRAIGWVGAGFVAGSK